MIIRGRMAVSLYYQHNTLSENKLAHSRMIPKYRQMFSVLSSKHCKKNETQGILKDFQCGRHREKVACLESHHCCGMRLEFPGDNWYI